MYRYQETEIKIRWHMHKYVHAPSIINVCVCVDQIVW
jgi:hypothetical protein